MQNKKILLRVFAFLLLSISLFSAFVVSGLAALSDYSQPGAQDKITLDEIDIVEMVLKEELSELEKEYISAYGDFSISYSTSVSASGLSSEYNREEKELCVTALEYVYTAANSVVVTWVPVSAEVRGVTLEFEKQTDGKYVAVFEGVESGEENTAKVKYTSSIAIPKEAINSLINIGYQRTMYWRAIIAQKNAEYEAALEQYESDVQSYDEYIAAYSEYEAALAVYKKYLSDYRVYQEKLEEYAAYVSAELKYSEDLKNYNAYLAAKAQYDADYISYLEYLAALEAYPGKVAEYSAYLLKLAEIRTQLAVIEANKTAVTELKRTLYSAILGGTVTDVLENKDAIANNAVGADPAVIDRAGIATENLRVLLTEYFSKKTEAEKYSYYFQNYEGFRDNFAELLRTLDELYKNPKIRAAIKTEGKEEKFVILIAQLHYMTLALADGPVKNLKGTAVYDENYLYGNRDYTFYAKNTIDSKTFLTKAKTPTPIEGGYPALMAEPVAPTEVKEPEKPQEVKEPTPPVKVEEPTPPAEVIEPVEPKKVSKPGAKPTPYAPAKEILELFELGLEQRAELTEDYIIPLESVVTKTFIGAKEATVVYHNLAGEEIYRVTVEVGTYADFKGELPAKEEDDVATYVFAGWVDKDGNSVDLSKIADDIHVYPTFKTVYKYVDIKWNVEGEIYTQSVLVGETPKYTETPTKPETDSMYFVFAGWDKEIVPAKDSITYTALFDSFYKSFDVSFDVNGKLTTEKLLYGEMPEYDGKIEKPSDSKMYYTFVGWDSEISSVTKDVVYTAVFEGKYIVPTTSGGADVTINNGNYVVDFETTEERYDIGTLIAFASESGSITLNTPEASIILSYTDTLAAYEAGVAFLKFNAKALENGAYTYSVSLFDADGVLINAQVKVKLSTACETEDTESIVLYYIVENGAERIVVPFAIADGVITFDAYSAVEYNAVLEYSVSVYTYPISLPTVNPVSLFIDKTIASPGDIVTFSINTPMGVLLKSLYYVDSAGNRTAIDGDSFVMPMGSVSVGADFEYIKYTVSFISDGKTISSAEYYYGEALKIPLNPEKATNTEYSYTFKEWSLPLSVVVTENATYEAVFTAEKLPEKTDEGLKIQPRLLRLIVTGFALLGTFLLMFIPAVIIGIILKVCYKKQFVKQKKSKQSNE